MRGRKAKACYQCGKGNNLETLSNKYQKKKSISHRGEILIYNASFYIFKLIFAILLALQTTYREFTEQMDRENSRVLEMAEMLGQFY